MQRQQTVFGCPLGRVAYAPTWTLQEKLKNRLVTTRKHGEHLPHLLLLLEHPPVYTIGKSGQSDHMLLDEDYLSKHGIEFFQIGRGGDITYHGPGQLVVYFLLDLNQFYRDLHRFMRDLEEIVIRTLHDFNLTGFRVPGRTGVWVGTPGQERKICAFGIRCSRWVTMHGLALNVNTNLSFFNHIVPCGITDRSVTSISMELERRCDLVTVSKYMANHFADVFEANMRLLDEPDAYSFLESYAEWPNLRDALRSTTILASPQ